MTASDLRPEHRPCSCPHCRAPDPARLRLRWFRVVLVLLGGVVLPAVSLLINSRAPLVDLGAWGTAALLLAMLAAVANLLLCPTRRDPRCAGVEVRGPRATSTRVLLLAGSIWGCLTWGYLAVLMLPLLPISILAVALLGLGLCGLSPFFALAIAVVQARRGAHLISERVGRGRTAALIAGSVLAPVLLAAGTAWLSFHRQVRLEQQLEVVRHHAAHSEERVRQIAALAGSEDLLPHLYLRSTDDDQRALIAESYLLLTDERLHAAVEQARRQQSRVPIQPWWFLRPDGMEFPLSRGLLGALMWRL